MENQFVPFELAVKLKELGFNEPCIVGVKNNETLTGTGFTFTNFNNNVHDFVLPLWQQAFDFISSKVNFEIDDNTSYALTFDGEFSLELREYYPYEGYSINDVVTGNYETLKKLIELCK